MLKPNDAGVTKLGMTEAADLSTSDWSSTEKEQAAKILSKIEAPEKRRRVLSKIKSYKDLSPTEAYKKIQKHREDRKETFWLKGSLI